MVASLIAVLLSNARGSLGLLLGMSLLYVMCTLALGLSTAQWLCVPMVIVGAIVLRHSGNRTSG